MRVVYGLVLLKKGRLKLQGNGRIRLKPCGIYARAKA